MRPQSIIYQQSWLAREAPSDWSWEGEITWSAIMWHVQDNQDIRASPHGLMVLANLISFYDKVSSLVDQRMAGDVAYQHFRKDSGSFPQHLSWRNCLWLFSFLSRRNQGSICRMGARASSPTKHWCPGAIALLTASAKGSLSGLPKDE